MSWSFRACPGVNTISIEIWSPSVWKVQECMEDLNLVIWLFHCNACFMMLVAMSVFTGSCAAASSHPNFDGCIYFQAATLVIKESVEPLLEQYRPPGITKLKFSKLSLGNVAPKIEGMIPSWSLILHLLFLFLVFSPRTVIHSACLP